MGKKPTSIVGATIDQSVYKFRASGKFLSASNSRIVFADSDDWWFAGGDFTLGTWINFITLPAPAGFMSLITQLFDANNSWGYNIYNTGAVCQLFFFANVGGVIKIQQVSNWAGADFGHWHYFESCRNGANWYNSIDGIQLPINGGGVPPGANVLNNLAANMEIGRLDFGGGIYYLNAYLDDLFIDKGVANHTADFAVPVAPKIPNANTVLYLPYDVDFNFADVDHDETAAADLPSRDFAHNALGDPTFNLQTIQTPARDAKNKLDVQFDLDRFVVYDGGGAVYTDWTPQARDAVVNDFPLTHAVWNANNRTFIGWRSKFDTALINVSVNSVGLGGFVWEYWNGGAYVSLIDFYDSSDSFKNGTFTRINHTPQADWAQQLVNGNTMYWLTFRQSGALAPLPRGTQAWLGRYTGYKRLVNYTRAKTLIGR